jgi:predicted RNA-binding protein YlxR (DUF448 family)
MPTHTPIRQCAGCRERKPQASMRRFVRADAAGRVRWLAGEGKRRSGRGVYLCSAECVKRVEKNRKFPGLAAAAVENGFLLG